MGEIVSLEEAMTVRGKLQIEGKAVVFTNGHFDLLHVGHVDYLHSQGIGRCADRGAEPEAEVVTSYGGQVCILSYLLEHSTTGLIETIVERFA